MQNGFKDAESVYTRPDLTNLSPELPNPTQELAKSTVLRGNVIAESEQDLAELLSRYQQGYYRPKVEGSVSLLAESVDTSNLQKIAETIDVGFQDSMREEERKGGHMMQLNHVAKARLLMRYPILPNSQQSTLSGHNGYLAHREQHHYQQQKLQQQPVLNTSRWPLSFGNVVAPERSYNQNIALSQQPEHQNSFIQDYPHWVEPPQMQILGIHDNNNGKGVITGMNSWNTNQTLTSLVPESHGFQALNQRTICPYSSNSYSGRHHHHHHHHQQQQQQQQQFEGLSGYPSSPSQFLVIPKYSEHQYSVNPYHHMIPTPFLKKDKSVSLEQSQQKQYLQHQHQHQQQHDYSSNFSYGDFNHSNVINHHSMDAFLGSQESARSSQDKLTSSYSAYGTDDSGLEFIDQLLSPGSSSPMSTARKYEPPKSKSKRGKKQAKPSQQNQDLYTNESIYTSGEKEGNWLLEKLSSLSPADMNHTEDCLVWNNNDLAEQYLLTPDNSSFSENPFDKGSKFGSSHSDEEVNQLMEKTGLASIDSKLSSSNNTGDCNGHPCTCELSKNGKEDILELAFCCLGKKMASVEELQGMFRKWVSKVPDTPVRGGSEDQQIQYPSLDNWIGIKHARTLSKGTRGQKCLESRLKKDKRFVHQQGTTWCCTNTDNGQMKDDTPLGSSNSSSSYTDHGKNKIERGLQKRKTNDSTLQSCSELDDLFIPDTIFRKHAKTEQWNLQQ